MIKLVHKNLCIGCAVCHDVCPVSCIDMEYSDEGFLYPRINYDKCTHCGQCNKVCSMLNFDKLKKVLLHKAYAAWAIDYIKRFNSTFGSVFRVLAEYGYNNGWTVVGAGIFNDYLEYLEIKHKKKSKSYNFRRRNFGWSKKAVEILFINEKKKSYRDRYYAYQCWFGEHLSIRTSCFNCKYRTRERIADITLGDFWGVQYLLPNIDVSKGVNLVYVNTVKGTSSLESCANKFHLNRVDIEKSLEGRKTVLNNFDMPNKRDEFMKDFKRLSIDDLIKKYPPAIIFETIILKMKRLMVK